MSLPARGAWIEIVLMALQRVASQGRSPHGERGLKSDTGVAVTTMRHVAPRTGSVD